MREGANLESRLWGTEDQGTPSDQSGWGSTESGTMSSGGVETSAGCVGGQIQKEVGEVSAGRLVLPMRPREMPSRTAVLRRFNQNFRLSI